MKTRILSGNAKRQLDASLAVMPLAAKSLSEFYKKRSGSIADTINTIIDGDAATEGEIMVTNRDTHSSCAVPINTVVDQFHGLTGSAYDLINGMTAEEVVASLYQDQVDCQSIALIIDDLISTDTSTGFSSSNTLAKLRAIVGERAESIDMRVALVNIDGCTCSQGLATLFRQSLSNVQYNPALDQIEVNNYNFDGIDLIASVVSGALKSVENALQSVWEDVKKISDVGAAIVRTIETVGTNLLETAFADLVIDYVHQNSASVFGADYPHYFLNFDSSNEFTGWLLQGSSWVAGMVDQGFLLGSRLPTRIAQPPQSSATDSFIEAGAIPPIFVDGDEAANFSSWGEYLYDAMDANSGVLSILLGNTLTRVVRDSDNDTVQLQLFVLPLTIAGSEKYFVSHNDSAPPFNENRKTWRYYVDPSILDGGIQSNKEVVETFYQNFPAYKSLYSLPIWPIHESIGRDDDGVPPLSEVEALFSLSFGDDYSADKLVDALVWNQNPDFNYKSFTLDAPGDVSSFDRYVPFIFNRIMFTAMFAVGRSKSNGLYLAPSVQFSRPVGGTSSDVLSIVVKLIDELDQSSFNVIDALKWVPYTTSSSDIVFSVHVQTNEERADEVRAALIKLIVAAAAVAAIAVVSRIRRTIKRSAASYANRLRNLENQPPDSFNADEYIFLKRKQNFLSRLAGISPGSAYDALTTSATENTDLDELRVQLSRIITGQSKPNFWP